MNSPPIGHVAFFERLAVALVLGLVIGFERQWRQRTAGLHTSTIVAVGAALFTAIPELAGGGDTWRVVATVVSGVGFLAGGVILREGFNVRGLITAATLWATAAVGALAGTGFELQATVGAAVIVLANLFCLPLANAISRIPRAAGEQVVTTYTLHVRCNEQARSAVREQILHKIRNTSLALTTMSSSAPSNGTIEMVTEMTKPGGDDGTADAVLHTLEAIDGVSSAAWQAVERST
jgi:putative Mg2+ transporter-C (MgtC) family protein